MLPVDVVGHPRLLGVVTGKAQHVGIDVVTQEPFFEGRANKVVGFFASALPRLCVESRPTFGDKIAAQPGSDIAAQEGGFDGNRAGAAKWVGQHAARSPIAKLHQHRGKRFAELGFTHQAAIAAFVQTDASGVERERGDVIAQCDFNRAERAGFRQSIWSDALSAVDRRSPSSRFSGRLARWRVASDATGR